MKVLLSWLREFVDVPVEPRKLADDLTLVGLAVDAVRAGRDRHASSTSTSRRTASTA